MNQLADDVHFLDSPFLLIWHMIIVFALLFLSPLIFGAKTTIAPTLRYSNGW